MSSCLPRRWGQRHQKQPSEFQRRGRNGREKNPWRVKRKNMYRSAAARPAMPVGLPNPLKTHQRASLACCICLTARNACPCERRMAASSVGLVTLVTLMRCFVFYHERLLTARITMKTKVCMMGGLLAVAILVAGAALRQAGFTYDFDNLASGDIAGQDNWTPLCHWKRFNAGGQWLRRGRHQIRRGCLGR